MPEYTINLCSHQLSELAAVAVEATLPFYSLSTVGVDNRNLQNYLKRVVDFCQLLELTNVAFRATLKKRRRLKMFYFLPIVVVVVDSHVAFRTTLRK